MLAEKKWGGISQNSFIKSDTLADFNPTLEQFDISIAMETMEHLPLAELHGYMEKLRLSTKNYLFISVPIEKGPIPVFFNYSTFIKDLSVYFEVLEITGLPLQGITPWLNFSVGIVARPKTH